MVGIVSIALLCVYIAGSLSGWWEAAFDLDTVGHYLTLLSFLFLGQLILWRAGGNRIGWVFTAIGLMILLSGMAAGFADRGVLAFQAIGGGLWLGWFALLGTLVLWYPTGEVPSRRWLWLQWLGFALFTTNLLLYTFAEQICVGEGGNGCGAWAANPIGIAGVPNPEYGSISGPLFSLFLIFVGGAVLSLFMRYSRAGTVERLQLKWFLLACASFLLGITTELILSANGYAEAPLLVDVWISISLVAVPVAATLAIFRYRLYEIDQIVSRTVAYAIVVVALGAVYLTALSALTTLLPSDSPLAVAAATLGAAALFNPLRRRVQAAVDHRFNRSRYDAEQVVAGFTGSLRDEVDPNLVVSGWISVVEDTMHPASFGVWVRSQK